MLSALHALQTLQTALATTRNERILGEHLAVADRHQLVGHAVEIRLLEVVRVREHTALLVVRTLEA